MIPATLDSDHDDSASGSPASQILALLPKSSLLALRVVSRKTKAWTETLETSVFSALHIVFPVPELLSLYPTALHRIAEKCQRLTVQILGTALDMDHFRDLPEQSILPAFPILNYLRVIPPTAEPFNSWLVFRIFLQSASMPKLKHIAIENLTLNGIVALRWGPFCSYVEGTWGSSRVWKGITVIELKLIPWWKNEIGPAKHGITVETCSKCGGPHFKPESEIMRVKRKIEKGEERAGIKVLHDWLKSFGLNTMEKIKIEWTKTTASQCNPLLLDEFAARDGKGKWFSAPPIRWKNGCKEVWLGGVLVGPDDLEAMEERIQGLEKVMVWRGWLGAQLTGTKIEVGGREWVAVDIKVQKMITEKEKEWRAKMEQEQLSRKTKLRIKVKKVRRTASKPGKFEGWLKNGKIFEVTSPTGMNYEGTLEEEEDESDSLDMPMFLLPKEGRTAI